MEQVLAALDAVWKVTVVGLVLGAGLPALFSLGVRAQASGRRGWAYAAYAVVGLADRHRRHRRARAGRQALLTTPERAGRLPQRPRSSAPKACGST